MVKWWEPMAVESRWGGMIHLLVIIELVLCYQLKFIFVFIHEPCEATIIIFFSWQNLLLVTLREKYYLNTMKHYITSLYSVTKWWIHLSLFEISNRYVSNLFRCGMTECIRLFCRITLLHMNRIPSFTVFLFFKMQYGLWN